MGNTIDLEFGRQFLAATLAIKADRNVRAVVLTGQGKVFCFGGDLKHMTSSGGDIGAYLSELTINLHAAIAHLSNLAAPVIAAVNGPAAGAGMGLVLSADIAIAARSAKFVTAYAGVGLTPDAGCTTLLPRAVGYKRAMELFLLNRVLDSQRALDWGLVNQVVDDDKLAETVTAVASVIVAGPQGAFGAMKRLIAESQPGFEAQLARESRAIAAQGMTAEGSEGIAAFLQKRPPRFNQCP